MPQPRLTKYELCWCGSGLFYVHCHKSIDEAPVTERLNAAHRQYKNNWMANAAQFASRGLYDWMAVKLKSVAPKSVLDVGAGTGEGIEALLRAYDCKILSIEENRECLHSAASSLAAKGYEVLVNERLQFVPLGPEHHRLDVLPGLLRTDAQVSLIESDWLADDVELFGYLADLPKFDAVTVWLIGTHSLRPEAISVAKVTDAAHYRLFVQNRVYEVANVLLRPGGVLHVVDRGVPLNTEARRQTLWDAHREQASVTSLEVYELDSISYTEPAQEARIKMQAVENPKRNAETSSLEVVSILSRKP